MDSYWYLYTQQFYSMTKPKRSSDDYIQLNKKITDKEIRNIIGVLARDRRMTHQEVCYEFIRIGAIAEINKRKTV
jgi:hypothetical protein